MKKIIVFLEEKKIPLSTYGALEIFARDGSWQTIVYKDKVKNLDAWEIDSQFEQDLRDNLPKAHIKITNSIEEIRKKEHWGKYKFIVVDNPQGCYGPNGIYCEHFDVIPQICELLDKEGILIFNLNKAPFNYENSFDWQARRSSFYNLEDTSNLSLSWLLNYYETLFKKNNFVTEFCSTFSRGDYQHNDYLHYGLFLLKKND